MMILYRLVRLIETHSQALVTGLRRQIRRIEAERTQACIS